MYRQTPYNETYRVSHNISQIKSLDYLIKQYPNQRIIPQFIKLKENYPFYRAVSGDGNCFYRVIAFLYLREADLSRFESVFQQIPNQCHGIPVFFEGMSFSEYLQDIFMKNLRPLSVKQKSQRQQALIRLFNSIPFDPILIIYFRSLNYLNIKKNYKKYENFIDQELLYNRIRQFGHDSQGIQYLSMANALNIQIVIHVTNQYHLKTQQYGQYNRLQTYELFFRPGHFDILYHKDSQFIKKNTLNLNNQKSINKKNHIDQYNHNPFLTNFSSRQNQANQRFKFSNFQQQNYQETKKKSQFKNRQSHQKMGYQNRQSTGRNKNIQNFTNNKNRQSMDKYDQNNLGMNSNDIFLNNLRMNSLNNVRSMNKQIQKSVDKQKNIQQKKQQKQFKGRFKQEKSFPFRQNPFQIITKKPQQTKGLNNLRKDMYLLSKKSQSPQKLFQTPGKQDTSLSGNITPHGNQHMYKKINRKQKQIKSQKLAIQTNSQSSLFDQEKTLFSAKFKQYFVLVSILSIALYLIVKI